MHSETAQQEEIKKILRKRGKTYIEKTLRNEDKDILEKLKLQESNDGWEEHSRNYRPKKKTLKLRKDKPSAEQLENEVWCMLAKMGFNEMSKDEKFFFDEPNLGNSRQIDIFAKDENCVLLVECQQKNSFHQQRSSAPRIAQLIDKIEGIRGGIEGEIRRTYKDIKIKWVIATRRIQWGEADLQKASKAGIGIIQDNDIDYFKKNTDLLKTAARFQLLAFLFKNQGIKGLSEIKVLATQGTMSGSKYYTFLASPADLLKISYVAHVAHTSAVNTYQRLVKPARLKQIGQFIDDGGQFPTNVIINFKQKKKLVFEEKGTLGDLKFGFLKLPNVYGSAWLVDGQHRVYGYAYSERSKRADKKTFFPILAYDNLDPDLEKQLFVDINSKQVSVPKNVLDQIIADVGWSSSNVADQLHALRARVINDLNSKQGPLYGKFKSELQKQTLEKCLTTTNFNDGLKDNQLIGQIVSGNLVPGPLFASDAKEDERLDVSLRKAVLILNNFFQYFQKNNDVQWELGSKGFLATNLGIRTLLGVLKHLLNHIQAVESIQLLTTRGEYISDLLEPYLAAISEFFKGASDPEIKRFKQNSSKAGVTQNTMHLMVKIHESIPEFKPRGLDDFIKNSSQESTQEAQGKVTKVQKMINECVKLKLIEHYSEADWFVKSVPKGIRTKCVTRKIEAGKDSESDESFLDLLDYYQIVIQKDNWPIFENIFSFGDAGKRESRTKWMRDLNEIRNTAFHSVERGPLTNDQLTRLDEVYEFCEEKLKV